jgi:flagellar biosynthesis/type III secretory pathway protein FliH
VLRGALRKAYVRDRLQVVCNPEDLALVEQAEETLQAQVGTLKNLELVGDRRVQRGGVVVRTPGGDVDATLGSQLDRLRAAMLGEDARDG